LDSIRVPMDCMIAATSVPFFSGSMMIIHCVAGPVWTLLSLDAAQCRTHSRQCRTQKAWQF
jgi:hypothetical protein